MKELAIFGGPPLFEEPKHVGRPNLAAKSQMLEAFSAVLDSYWLTNNGAWVQMLETRLRQMLGVEHCIVVTNGTSGLEIAARALMPRFGEVITPSFTFVATPHSLAWQGYTPIFADIDPRTHVLDPIDVESKITDNTVGILGVHTWGSPCAPTVLEKIAAKYDIVLFFDAAHAYGCSTPAGAIGGFGDCEVFSFHATKFFNTAEGGAITTNNGPLAQRLRELRNFGFIGDGSHSVSGLGINAKMSELHAAAGVTNLIAVPEVIAWNRYNYYVYVDHLQHSNIRVYLQEGQRNFQYVVIEVSGALSADALVWILQAEGVLARRYFSPPCHLMPPYSDRQWCLPATERVANQTVVLPTGLAVSPRDVIRICEVVQNCIEDGAAISDRMEMLNG